MASSAKSERIQKVLARAGLGSRREIEGWIKAGRIRLNGRTASLGDCMDRHSRVQLDGRPLALNRRSPLRTRVLLYHKPAGEICTRQDRQERETVYRSLPGLKTGRWIGIGRLDINTSGLLLFTNDGDLANFMMHPSNEIEREYAVRVLGKVDKKVMENLLAGVRLQDGLARFESIRDAGGEGANHWYHVVISEGRNRGVRRLWESQGLTISRLIRIRYGPCTLGNRLRPGRYAEMTANEVKQLKQTLGLRE